ncbi:MAG: type IIL restriction-modification enzyme MmeI [Phycisphaerales bacterium]
MHLHHAREVVTIRITTDTSPPRRLFTIADNDSVASRTVPHINAYLVAGHDVFVTPKSGVPDDRTPMQFGNHPYYANKLMLRAHERDSLILESPQASQFIRPLYGSKEFIEGNPRFCLWIDNRTVADALAIEAVRDRVEAVRRVRLEKGSDAQSLKLAATPYRFRDQYQAAERLLVVPIVSTDARQYLPIGLAGPSALVHNKAFALYDAPLWNMSLIASRLHRIWIGTVCARLRNDPSYSNTLGWNTFPVPALSDQHKADLTRCAEDILLAREAHFPATIADLYDPEAMPADLRAAHDRNDETLERIYIGRRFRNDTERLEKLFDMYTQMTAKQEKPAKRGKAGKK